MTYYDDWYESTIGKMRNAGRDELKLVISLSRARIERYKAELKAAEDILARKYPNDKDVPPQFDSAGYTMEDNYPQSNTDMG